MKIKIPKHIKEELPLFDRMEQSRGHLLDKNDISFPVYITTFYLDNEIVLRDYCDPMLYHG